MRLPSSRRAAGLTPALRSRGELPERGNEIYVADTMGELGLIYRLAPIVFMGGSLVRTGGQNPIEPIKLGAAILHGPHVWNFADIYSALDGAGGAKQVNDAQKLAVCIGDWLTDTAARGGRPEAGRARSTCWAARCDRTLRRSSPISCNCVLGETRAMREPVFLVAQDRPRSLWRCYALRRAYGAVAARRMARRGHVPACR